MTHPQWITLREYFRNCYEVLQRTGDVPYRLTAKGAWACSRVDVLYSFFRQLNLTRYRCFVDLGSGDGAVTCLAGLFTRAVGIEIDARLCARAKQAARELGLDSRVDFIRSDFSTQKIQQADCLYVYPDKPIYGIEALLDDWQGDLLVYGPHFPPARMQPVRRLRGENEQLVVYRN